LLEWLRSFGEIHAIAVESTGSYAAALVRFLREHDVTVVEVNQPHAHSRRRVGKSDPIDAEMAARLFLAGRAKSVPKQTDGIVESIRLLRVARDSAVKSRSAALVQIRDLIITAPQELRDQLSDRKTLCGKATVCARSRRSALRSVAQRLEALDREIAALDRDLKQLCRHGRVPHYPAARHLHRTRRPTARDRRTEHRSSQRRKLVRDALRRESDPCLFRQDRPPIGSTPAATAKPTALFTWSWWFGCATANAPAHVPQPRLRNQPSPHLTSIGTSPEF
jgi:hypothetical protein